MDEKERVKIQLAELGNTLINKLRQEDSLVKIPKARKTFKGKIEESAVLLLSDMHLGKENHFIDMDTGKDYLTYSPDIAVKEADRLLDGIYGINRLLSRSYKIDTLYLFVLGDIVEGQELFADHQLLISSGIGNQMLFAVKLFTDLITELLKEFKHIKMVNVPGNHGRLSKETWSTDICYNNFDFLMGKMLQEVFRNEKRVVIETPEAWFYRTKIYNWNYFLHHGATVRSWMGFPLK